MGSAYDPYGQQVLLFGRPAVSGRVVRKTFAGSVARETLSGCRCSCLGFDIHLMVVRKTLSGSRGFCLGDPPSVDGLRVRPFRAAGALVWATHRLSTDSVYGLCVSPFRAAGGLVWATQRLWTGCA